MFSTDSLGSHMLEEKEICEQGPFKVVSQKWLRQSMSEEGQWLPAFDYLTVKSGPTVVLLGQMEGKFLLTVNFRPVTVNSRYQGFLTEALAGRVKPDENFETAVRREFREEVKGLRIKGSLKRVFAGYASPGILDEELIFYTADLEKEDEPQSHVSGVEEEGEEVGRFFAPLDEILDEIKGGGVQDLKLIALAYYIALFKTQELLVDKEIAISHIPRWLRTLLNWWYKIRM